MSGISSGFNKRKTVIVILHPLPCTGTYLLLPPNRFLPSMVSLQRFHLLVFDVARTTYPPRICHFFFIAHFFFVMHHVSNQFNIVAKNNLRRTYLPLLYRWDSHTHFPCSLTEILHKDLVRFDADFESEIIKKYIFKFSQFQFVQFVLIIKKHYS